MGAIAIVQARMGSSRRPGKSMVKIDSEPLIIHVLDRALRIRSCSAVVLATSSKKEDDELVEMVSDRYNSAVDVFRGDSQDVQSRFIQVGELYEADYIARITADDPFKDPAAYDKTLSIVDEEGLDYVALRHDLLPLGLDAEVFAFPALRASREHFDSAENREHVTAALRTNHEFSRRFVEMEASAELAHIRLTVDYDSDIPLNTKVARALRESDAGLGLTETISHLRKIIRAESR